MLALRRALLALVALGSSSPGSTSRSSSSRDHEPHKLATVVLGAVVGLSFIGDRDRRLVAAAR